MHTSRSAHMNAYEQEKTSKGMEGMENFALLAH